MMNPCIDWTISRKKKFFGYSSNFFKSPDSCAEERNRTLSAVTSTEQIPMDQRKSSLAFKDISANTIAEQLTYLEYRMLRRIPVSVLISYSNAG